MTTTSLKIYASQAGIVRARVAAFNAKAAKLGCPAAVVTLGEPYRQKVTLDSGWEFFATLIEITLTGEVAKLAGWTFVAALEHTPAGNIIRSLSDEDLPVAFRTSAATCDHCGLDRNRNNTYVLRHEDGRWAQVGSTCLHDFLGVNPQNALWFSENLASLLEDDEIGLYGSRSVEDAPLVDVVAVTAAVVAKFGWVSKKLASTAGGTATAEIVKDYIFNQSRKANELRREVGPAPTTPEVEAAIEWAKHLTGDSDYEYTLRVLAANGNITLKNFGFACSIFSSYRRSVEKAAVKAARKPSEFVGAVNDKIVVEAAKVINAREFEPYAWGAPARLLVVLVANDNIFKTWTTVDTAFGREVEVGKEFTIKGTVKAHEIYNDRYETVLTRVKVA